MGEWIWVWIEVSVRGRKVLLVLGEEISYLWVSAQATYPDYWVELRHTWFILCVWVCVGVLLGQILIKKVKNSVNK